MELVGRLLEVDAAVVGVDSAVKAVQEYQYRQPVRAAVVRCRYIEVILSIVTLIWESQFLSKRKKVTRHEYGGKAKDCCFFHNDDLLAAKIQIFIE